MKSDKDWNAAFRAEYIRLVTKGLRQALAKSARARQDRRRG